MNQQQYEREKKQDNKCTHYIGFHPFKHRNVENKK